MTKRVCNGCCKQVSNNQQHCCHGVELQMLGFLLLFVVSYSVNIVVCAPQAFPIFVDGQSDPIYMYYGESDLETFPQMVIICSNFVRENADSLHISSSALTDMQRMATTICQAVAQQNDLKFKFELTDFYSRKEKTVTSREPHQIVSLVNVLSFMKDGWTVIPNALPELKDEMVLRNVNETLKQRKFEYIIDALYMANKKWGINPKDTATLCGAFDERVLNDANLVDDAHAEYLYKLGLSFVICTLNYHIVHRPQEFIYVPFNQVINMHRINDVIYDLATSQRLGFIAASLLQHDTVRLYQTALFSKENTGLNLATQWHRDLNMAPINAKDGGSVTFWCPVLRRLDRLQGDSMLRFLSGSHRDISVKNWYNDFDASAEMVARYGGYAQARALDVGDCTAHHGWVLHDAPPQPKESEFKDRLAIGFTYVAGDATVLTDLYSQTDRTRRANFGDEDEYSYRDWIKDLNEGDVIDHPLLPVVFDVKQGQ